jgi:hypothetical protein
MNRKTRIKPTALKPMITNAILIFTLATLLTSCTMTPSVPQKSEVPEVTPQPSETPTPAPTLTATPTQTATPAPFYQVNEPGEAFSPQQEAINKSQSALEQKARIQRWLDYWVKFDNCPFAWESTELHWKYIYDNEIEPNEVGVLIEVGGEYQGKLFTVPSGDGVLAEFPPEYDGGEIETGFGPLELSAGAEGQWLSVQNGIPVRRDAKGQIVEELDMIKGVWVEVEKYPIDLEKLRNFPQSYEYLVAHPEEFVEAPDGVADPQALLDWYYNKFVPTVGDQTKLEPSLTISNLISGEKAISVAIAPKEQQTVKMKNMMFIYFVHGEKKYTIPIFTLVDYRGYNYETFGIIVEPYTEVLENIHNGGIIFSMAVITSLESVKYFGEGFSDEAMVMINGEINGSESDTYYRMGIGVVYFRQ